MPLRVRRGRPLWVRFVCPAFVCVITMLHLLILGKCYAVHINASSLYNESVHRKKHYTCGNNTIPYKLARLVTFEILKWKYSFATNSTMFMKLGSLLYVRCRHRSVKSTAVSNKTFLFQLTNIYLFWGSVTLST